MFESPGEMWTKGFTVSIITVWRWKWKCHWVFHRTLKVQDLIVGVSIALFGYEIKDVKYDS